MIKSVNVIGRGRVGSALAARREERGVELREDAAELTLLCVPDTAIRNVARGLAPGHGSQRRGLGPPIRSGSGLQNGHVPGTVPGTWLIRARPGQRMCA